MSCDRKNARVNQTEHSVLEHHLLLIHDSVEVKSVKSAKSSDVERQLDDLNTSIAALDEKMTQQLEEAKDLKLVVAKTMGLKDYDLMSSASAIDWEEGLDAEAARALDESSNSPQEGELTEEEKESEPVDSEVAKPASEPKPAEDGPADGPEAARAPMQPLNVRERLATLETRVDSIFTHLAQDNQHAMLARKMDALEAKMDQQFGTLLTLMQNFTAVAGASCAVPDGTTI
jgi:hypothetical protein